MFTSLPKNNDNQDRNLHKGNQRSMSNINANMILKDFTMTKEQVVNIL